MHRALQRHMLHLNDMSERGDERMCVGSAKEGDGGGELQVWIGAAS